MVQANVFLSGRVQGVCCRAFVRATALREGVKGLVRNTPDGRVEVFCEADSREKILDFVKKIGVKESAGKGCGYGIHVKEARVVFEGEKEFRKAWAAYQGFEVSY